MRSLTCIVLFFFSSQLFAQNEVIYLWSGALSPNSIRVNAKMTDTSSTIRLMVDDDSAFASPLFSPYYSVDTTTNMMVSMLATGLNPGTKYFYAVESGGIADTSADDIGSFHTAANGPWSFSFVAGSCSVNSNHPVYDAMKGMKPDLYLQMGDLHYDNPSSDLDINVHRMPYENSVLSKPRIAAFLKRTPIAYMWDDHDFCGNDSDSNSVGKENAKRAYHEYVPHYPMGLGCGPLFPICQAFTLGRIHFILTDQRSERDPGGIFSPAQRTWFENECLYARDNNLVICWMSSYSWSGSGTDNWGYFYLERTSINDFLYCNQVENMFIMSGDAHMLGIDNGTNANFSSNLCEYYNYPIFQAAALNNWGSYKGGVYSEGGYFVNPDLWTGQFGKVDVTDNGGDSICISFRGYKVDSSGTNIQLVDSFNFCRYTPLLSVKENNFDGNFVIQPNPSSSLVIAFKEEESLESVNVFSSSGEHVYSEKTKMRTRRYQPELNGLAAGSYVVEVKTQKGFARKLWIKTK